MKKNSYLMILTIVTVVCVLAGSAWHIFKWGFSLLDDFVPFFDTDRKNTGKLLDETGADVEEFTSINIDASLIDLNIESGDRFSISYSGREKLRPEYEVKDSCLYVKQKEGKWWGSNTECSMTITVPKELAEVTVDASTGDIDFEGISIQSLKLDASLGDIDIEDCTIGDVDIDTSTGDLELGNIIFDTLKIDASMGDIRVEAAEDLSDYDIKVDIALGEITVNGQEYHDSYSSPAAGSDKSVTIDGSTGDIELSFPHSR